MSHEWDRGVLNKSSWHGLENIGTFTDAASFIAHGEKAGAYPITLTRESLTTESGLVCPSYAIRADYQAHDPRVFSAVGKDYHPLECADWRSLIETVVAAGGQPTGAFSLRGGARVLATFDVGGNGLRTHFFIGDSFDSSLSVTCGLVVTRVVCANTLAIAERESGLARLRHTTSLEARVKILREAIDGAIKTGASVKEKYNEAESTRLAPAGFKAAFDRLFPEAKEDATDAVKTKATNTRHAAAAAAFHPLNNVGLDSLGTLWNAATWLVDRTPTGESKPTRSDPLESMLFGSRGDRVKEIQRVVEAVMVDGTIQRMTVAEAREAGIEAKQIGKSIIADAIGDA